MSKKSIKYYNLMPYIQLIGAEDGTKCNTQQTYVSEGCGLQCAGGKRIITAEINGI